ncbi:coiled-coil domain-containing protein 135 [Strigomonas culicis]|uniref:Dynein regulatory complex subunit 7 n=1 Tax=Strigomonas culicis TaxID=28005 RepID=S9TS42_9TRYP|nr:coiled-coil domain-containing protein 135 [Strigomonas culicis]|eukprot:EPY19404.1 coiled-coil domain-containing protein 135 [Strigomonas culicis]
MASHMWNASRNARIAAFCDSSIVPPSYNSNSPSEEQLASFANEFSSIFHKYYPDRKPLLLNVFNECRKQKMICTFVRPTLLKFDELYDLEKCAKYMAGYMKYDTLHDTAAYDREDDDTVVKLPTLVVSPATALQWQTGTCVELSLILTSLLLGVGYNAFVVVGTATKSVCLNDQSGQIWEDDLPLELNSDDEDEPEPEIDDDYAPLLKRKPQLRKVTDKDPEYNFGDALGKNALNGEANSEDGRKKKPRRRYEPTHAWVLVLTGGRKSIKETLMIEPSTGKIFPTASSDSYYTGVDSVFNHKKYFVNLHPDTLVSALSMDLQDSSQWENVFPLAKEEEEPEIAGATLAQKTVIGLTTRRGMADTMTSGPIETPGDNWKPTVSIPASWSRELTLSPQQFESRYPGKCKEICYADAVVRLFADYSQPDLRIKEIVFSDELCRDLSQMHVFFRHRADKLRRRFTLPRLLEQPQVSKNKSTLPYRLLHEWYERGRKYDSSFEGLREFIYEPERQKALKFFWRSREDGLQSRVEVFQDESMLHQVEEFYKGRSDHMSYRSAIYDRPRTMKEVNQHALITSLGSGVGARELKEYPHLDPITIIQTYTRNETVPLDKDVAKVKFIWPSAQQAHTTVGEMWVFLHYPSGAIIRPYRIYAKTSSSVEDYISASASRKPQEPPVKVVTTPGTTAPSELELYKERKWLTALENTCVSDVRKKMNENVDILLRLEQDHASVVATLSSYDTLRNRPQKRGGACEEAGRHCTSRRVAKGLSGPVHREA